MLTVIQVTQVRAIHNPHHSICLLALIGLKRFLTTISPYIEMKAGQTKISIIHQKFLVLVVGEIEHKMELKKNEGLAMEYQMLTYFDQFTFSGLWFPQIAISYLSSTLCQNATFPIPHIPMLPTPHCLCYVANFYINPFPIPHCDLRNSTLSNCQLHIVSITLSTCRINFNFFGAPPFFKFMYWPLKN